ncbi:MAG: DUF1573 domain-containing protein [Bacteroidota bacterium]
MIVKYLYTGLIIGLSMPTLHAQLTWRQKSLDFIAEYGQKDVKAHYEFKNEGEQTVVIQEVKASCGCTVPKLEKKEYAPGETGQIEAIFTIGNRQGKQSKSLRVVTADGVEETRLILNVNIPNFYSVKPPFSFWRMNEGDKEKRVELSFNTPNPVMITELKMNNENFIFRKEVIKEGNEYILWVKPKDVQSRYRSMLEVFTDAEAENLKKFRLYFAVK